MSLSIFRRPTTSHSGLATVALCVLLAHGRWASADLAWHADLPAATAAAQASGKPVLAIVDAEWNRPDGTSSPDQFSNPEVAAVISACFEPVRLDVDADPQLARELGVEHVPTACVLDAHARPLTRFECSTDAALFVAAAARAAQVAAANRPSDAETAAEPGEAEGQAAGEQANRKGSANATASALANKVRNLAGFAESDPLPAGQPSRFRPVPVSSGFRSESNETTPATTTAATNLQELPSEPELPQSPSRWPAEAAPASAFTAVEPKPYQAPATNPPATRPWDVAPGYPTSQPPSGPAAAASIEPAGAVTGGWLAGSTAPNAPTTPAADPTADLPGSASNLPATTPSPEPEQQASASSSMMAFLKKPWSIFSRPAVEPTAPPPTLPPAKSVTPAAVAASAPPQAPDQHGSMPLGLEGYCPVTLVERGTWVEGRAQWGVRHRGRTYLFAGPEQQQAFLASPDRYAPALSGDDPVLAFESGRTEPGRRAYGVTYQARMYLFATPETRAAFSADPGRYTARVMIAEGLVANDGVRRF